MRCARAVRLFEILATVPLVFWSASLAVLAERTGFADPVELGLIANEDLAELSGVVASRRNPGVLWVHNDNARDRVYAISANGQLLATWKLSKAVTDFEDIAIGPGPQPELDYIYCADIGDNTATRSSIRIYRAPEPVVYSRFAAAPPSKDFGSVETIELIYPDGSHDAEGIMIDPMTGDLFVATKEFGITGIYRAERSQLRDDATVTLSHEIELNFHQVSGADISPDGSEIILRQEDYARLWRRDPGQTVVAALNGEPLDASVVARPIEPNGEGIAYDPDGLGYYTISEGAHSPIYFFRRLGSPLGGQRRRLILAESTWRYLDDGSNPGTAWRAPAFGDTGWRSGPAQFGYGDDDERTVIAFGSNREAKHVTTYFRKEFTIESGVSLGAVTLSAVYDDGIAVYINGTEVLRRNLAANAVFSDVALTSGGALENLWQSFAVLPNVLRAGANVIAVEVHRRSRSEGDLSFDLQLAAREAESSLGFAGPPQPVSPAAWLLNIRGPSAAHIVIEGSSTLNNWSQLGSLILTNGLATFRVSQTNGAAFYRLRQ